MGRIPWTLPPCWNVCAECRSILTVGRDRDGDSLAFPSVSGVATAAEEIGERDLPAFGEARGTIPDFSREISFGCVKQGDLAGDLVKVFDRGGPGVEYGPGSEVS